MTFTHALSTNNYGPTKFIVSSSPANGTHTTIASAIAAASSGDTVFVRDGSYTENLTMVPGIRLTAFSQGIGTSSVTVTGKMTFTTAGTYIISNINFVTNSDFIVSCTGANNCQVGINNCSLAGTNNTVIEFTNSNASSVLSFTDCNLGVSTTGITYFTKSSPGQLAFTRSSGANSGNSTTASTWSDGSCIFNYSIIMVPLQSSGTAATLNSDFTIFNTNAINTTAITWNSTVAADNASVLRAYIGSGTASVASVGAGATLTLSLCDIASDNANAITGSGTLQRGVLSFIDSSSTINTTTVIQLKSLPKVAPTVQVLTSGTGATYTTPANCQWIRVRAWGGGAGGQGSGTTPGGGGDGADTTFSAGSMVAAGGAANGNQGAASSGGNVINKRGIHTSFVGNLTASVFGGAGGATSLGGNGLPGTNAPGAGGGAANNCGSGGGGAGCAATVGAGFGGGSGGYSESIINNPAASYTYTIGAAGTAGTAGTGGAAGGAGGTGVIIVEEYYL